MCVQPRQRNAYLGCAAPDHSWISPAGAIVPCNVGGCAAPTPGPPAHHAMNGPCHFCTATPAAGTLPTPSNLALSVHPPGHLQPGAQLQAQPQNQAQTALNASLTAAQTQAQALGLAQATAPATNQLLAAALPITANVALLNQAQAPAMAVVNQAVAQAPGGGHGRGQQNKPYAKITGTKQSKRR